MGDIFAIADIEPEILEVGGFKYRKTKKYKYEAMEVYEAATGILGYQCDSHFAHLAPNGMLTIDLGFLWNGASGPAIDTKSFMRSSALHDALYGFMISGQLPHRFRDECDDLLKEWSLQDGMGRRRAGYVRWAVGKFGARWMKIGR